MAGLGLLAAFLTSTADRQSEPSEPPGDETSSREAADSHENRETREQSNRHLARRSTDPDSLANGEAENETMPLELSATARVELQSRMHERVKERSARLEELLAREGWGPEYTRSRYLLMRYELALEKILSGDFEVDFAPDPVRREGEPDSMSFWTSDYRDDRQLYAKITLDKNDETVLSASRRQAAEETIQRWQSERDTFNALPFSQRSLRIRQSRQAKEAITELARGNGQSGSNDSARRARLRQLKEQRLPWYLAVDEASCLVSIRRRAREAARKRGGL